MSLIGLGRAIPKLLKAGLVGSVLYTGAKALTGDQGEQSALPISQEKLGNVDESRILARSYLDAVSSQRAHQEAANAMAPLFRGISSILKKYGSQMSARELGTFMGIVTNLVTNSALSRQYDPYLQMLNMAKSKQALATAAQKTAETRLTESMLGNQQQTNPYFTNPSMTALPTENLFGMFNAWELD